MKSLNLAFVLLLAALTSLLSACGPTKTSTRELSANLYPPASQVVEYHTEWTENHYRKRIEEFKKEPLHFGDIVFIGNSITEGGHDWAAKLAVQHVKNRGISGDVTDGVLLRLNEVTYCKPEAVFILIGINDLFNIHYQKEIPSPEYVGKNIVEIINIIHAESPETRIYAQTILPTSADFMKDNIATVNAIIKSNEKKGNVAVIDLHSAFSDQKGFLKPDLTYDGTHLNDEGYAVWVALVKPFFASD